MTQNEARFACMEHIQKEKEVHKSLLIRYTAIALTISAVSICIFTLFQAFGTEAFLVGKLLLVLNGLNAIFYLGAAWPRMEGLRNCRLAEKHLAGYGFRGDCKALLEQYERSCEI